MERTTTRRRPEAERNVERILDGALRVLAERPDAPMSAIATASGVSRQTVYAHFPSREQLLDATLHRAAARAVEAMDAADLDDGPADAALHRLLDVSWASVSRAGALLEAATTALSPDAFRAGHAPVVQRLERLLERGRAEGAFDDGPPLTWAIAATLGLVHTAGGEVAAGRLSERDAHAALVDGVLRLVAAPSAPSAG